MFRFFRTVRQKLLAENKLTRYMVYALGEIILVVIGILIALQVNNWNEARKERYAEQDLLVRIHSDLVQDTLSFRSTIVQNGALREEIRKLLANMYDGVESIDQVRRMSAVYDKALDQVFAPNDNTYRSMLSSGTLGLIRNTGLKEAIVNLYGTYDQKSALLASINEWMLGVAISVDTETNFIKFAADLTDIFTTSEMLNAGDYAFINDADSPGFATLVRAISATAFNQSVRNTHYRELIELDGSVLRLIEGELE